MVGIHHIFLLSLALLLIEPVKAVQASIVREINLETSIGTLIGVTQMVDFDRQSKSATYFLGIPYAKPPIGERRFAKPEPYGEMKKFYNATYSRPHCIQTKSTYKYLVNYSQSEDCLYLNIYIPGESIQDGRNFPVMVYIHGGSFVDGGSDVYDGGILSAFNDVIVVTVNYRLNIFGFLSDGHRLKGNYGLWDMKLAIQWVHDNIQGFGGDPSRVTLFGNSAGGAAVLYQAIHPDNRGLFQRIISQSGSCFAFWAIQRTPAHNFRWYLSQVGCDVGNSAERMRCLRQKPVDILKLSGTEYTTHFVPSVDSDFLAEEPNQLSKRKTPAGVAAVNFFSELDLLNGVTSKDGAFALGYWSSGMKEIDKNSDIAKGVSKAFLNKKYIPEILLDMYGNIPVPLLEATKYQYTDWLRPNDPISVRDKLMQLESDVTFFVPALHTSKTHQISQGSNFSKNNYFYVFNHKPSFAPKPLWLTGATHVMELPYIFGFPALLQSKLVHDYDAINPFRVSQRDLRFSKAMMRYWSNFAKTGNPNLPEIGDNSAVPKWPSFDARGQKYLDLSPTMSSRSIKHHLAAPRVAFWENLAPALKSCDPDTNRADVLTFPAVSSITCLILLKLML